jgi:hypothetical protein
MQMSHEDDVQRNRRHWNEEAASYERVGEVAWARAESPRGIFDGAEAVLGMLPADIRSTRAVELGCGTDYVRAWMARRGVRITHGTDSP